MVIRPQFAHQFAAVAVRPSPGRIYERHIKDRVIGAGAVRTAGRGGHVIPATMEQTGQHPRRLVILHEQHPVNARLFPFRR